MDVELDASKLRADATVIDVPMAPVHADADLPPRERLKHVQTYSCYYGPDRGAALSHVDAAILHIPAQTPDDISKLNKLGVVTIGYLSVGEDEAIHVGNGPGALAEKPVGTSTETIRANPSKTAFGASFFANAADPAWREDRVAQAKHLCGSNPGDYGFQGIFSRHD